MSTENLLPELDDTEIRVLGALMEKAVLTPDYYPMTLNGLTNACNQKTSRKPVVEYDEETVVLALNSLKRRGLVSTETGGTNRAVKYKHNFAIVYPVGPAEVTVMCLLFLRGPLTPGEINTSSGRMFEFDSLQEVTETIDQLMGTGLVALLPKKAGQKESRYAHRFAPLPEYEDNPAQEPARKSVSDLENRISKLEADYLELKENLDKLMRELM